MANDNKNFNKGDLPDYQQQVVDKVVAGIEKAIADQENGRKWESPFANQMAGLPRNPVTGEYYKGENALIGLMSGYVDPRFMTFKQMEVESKRIGKPLHLEKGSKAIYFSKVIEVPKRDEQGNILKDEQGKPIADTWPNGDKKLARKWFAVFNASQIKGLEPFVKPNPEVKIEDTVKNLANALMEKDGLKIEHSSKGEAYYSPTEHKIHMPNVELFKSSEGYLQTFAHESIHSTMKSLERPIYKEIMEGKSVPWDSPQRSKEELCAELGSMFLSAELGTPHSMQSHENSVAYMKSWLSVLKNEKNFLHVASAQASKACAFAVGKVQEYVAEQEQVKLNTPQERMKLQVDRLQEIASNTVEAGKTDAFIKKGLTGYIKQNQFTKEEVQDFMKSNEDLAKFVDMKKAFPEPKAEKTKAKELAMAM